MNESFSPDYSAHGDKPGNPADGQSKAIAPTSHNSLCDFVGTPRKTTCIFFTPPFNKDVLRLVCRSETKNRQLQSDKKLLLRVNQIAGPGGILPISKSTWWAGVKAGRYPQPIKLGPRVTAWNKNEVLALLKGSGTPVPDATE
jgi:predicted DNA-binding transcriptional regulator AlpA